MSPTVLVTGGAGFIGSALVRRLRTSGAEVTVADLLPDPDRSHPSVVGDLRRHEVVEAAVRPGTEAVFHLAALTSVLQSVHQPEEVFQTNVTMTARLLERCRQVGVPSFVLASTNAVIGSGLAGRGGLAGEDGRAGDRRAMEESGPAGDRTPAGESGPGAHVIDEMAPLRPLTPYGATKAAGEMLLSAYEASYGMAAAAVRLTNVYGPGMASKDSIVPRLMRAALSGTGIRVHGHGQQVRDYLHVDDAVQALLLAWRQPVTGPLTVGSGRSTSVLEILEAARKVTGAAIPGEHVEPPPGEMPAVVVDIGRARSLGFEPSVDLAAGLASAWEDFRHREGPASRRRSS